MELAVPFEEFSDEIRRLMRSPIVTSHQPPEEAMAFARDNDGLLIGWDWWFTILRPSGEVVDWDPPSAPETRASYASLLQAIGGASELYPSLARFIPARPIGALDCHHCQGSGKVMSTTNEPMRCPMCGGLRWLPGEG
jgi:hypothetical protein